MAGNMGKVSDVNKETLSLSKAQYLSSSGRCDSSRRSDSDLTVGARRRQRENGEPEHKKLDARLRISGMTDQTLDSRPIKSLRMTRFRGNDEK